jgi:hypothetical protein
MRITAAVESDRLPLARCDLPAKQGDIVAKDLTVSRILLPLYLPSSSIN